jgi:hypothetical protein
VSGATANAYRRQSLLGSDASRCAHSIPARRIHKGARFCAPTRNSNEAPMHNPTPQASGR